MFSWLSVGGMREGIREGNLKKEHFTGKHTKHHTLGGRAYPVRHYPIAVRLRDREGHAILCIALNPQSGDFSDAILGVRSVALLHLIKSLFRKKSTRILFGSNEQRKVRKHTMGGRAYQVANN